MLSLGILPYIIQIYMWYFILFIDFEKFKVYNEFKNFKNNLNRLSEPEPTKIWKEFKQKFRNIWMCLKSLTPEIQNPNKSEPNPNGYLKAHP